MTDPLDRLARMNPPQDKLVAAALHAVAFELRTANKIEVIKTFGGDRAGMADIMTRLEDAPAPDPETSRHPCAVCGRVREAAQHSQPNGHIYVPTA